MTFFHPLHYGQFVSSLDPTRMRCPRLAVVSFANIRGNANEPDAPAMDCTPCVRRANCGMSCRRRTATVPIV
jgi:hypothetical protein